MPRTSGKRKTTKSKRTTPYQAKMRRTLGRFMRRSRKKLALKTHNFVERTIAEDFIKVVTNPNEDITGVNAESLFKSWSFVGVRQSSYYANIFEYYKINKIVVTFRYKGVGTAASASSIRPNEINPVLYIKRDYNDNQLDVDGNRESLEELKDSSKTFEVQLTNDKPSFTMSLKPSILTDDSIYDGSLGTNKMPVWGKWLSTKERGINHYGLKAFAVAQGSSSGDTLGKIEVSYKVYFSCKSNE